MPRPKLSDETLAKRRALGLRLKRERTTLDLSRDELAAMPQLARHAVTPHMIKRWEEGQASIPSEIFPELASSIGVTIARLLGEHQVAPTPASTTAPTTAAA